MPAYSVGRGRILACIIAYFSVSSLDAINPCGMSRSSASVAFVPSRLQRLPSGAGRRFGRFGRFPETRSHMPGAFGLCWRVRDMVGCQGCIPWEIRLRFSKLRRRPLFQNTGDDNRSEDHYSSQPTTDRRSWITRHRKPQKAKGFTPDRIASIMLV